LPLDLLGQQLSALDERPIPDDANCRLKQDQFNRPAATDDRQVEGPYRRVRLNAWLGHNALCLCEDSGMTTLNHRNVTLGKICRPTAQCRQIEMPKTLRITPNRGGVRTDANRERDKTKLTGAPRPLIAK